MVHALSEIHRVLVADGILIDLRPAPDRWQVEVTSAQELRETGRVQDLPAALRDDEAANRAVLQAAEHRWFSRDREEFFLYYYAWDTPSEMEEWIAAEWDDSIRMDEETKRATRSAWALGGAQAQVRLRVKMLITSWKVAKEL
jgi:hypothetical protein